MSTGAIATLTLALVLGTAAAFLEPLPLAALNNTQCVSTPEPVPREVRREAELRCFRQAAHIADNAEWMHAIGTCREEMRRAIR